MRNLMMEDGRKTPEMQALARMPCGQVNWDL
jgi:hypothetical protein